MLRAGNGIMLRESGIKKASESAGAQVTMSKSQGKIFTSGNVINDKYVILDFIGKGAFGEVYRAHQLNLQRDVAVKVVSREWLQSLEVDDAEIDTALQRFEREVQAMARVRHPNVLQVYDHGSAVLKKGFEDYPVEFIVMEYIPGETLRHTMSEEGFYPDPELTLEWLEDFFLPVLDGVEAIHVLDIAHRDLKPENVLMDGTTPKIADFGLARSSRLKPVTQSLEVKGTAHYMSPEHFFDFRKADQRADIYSLGKILFEAVAGKIGNGNIPFKSAGLPFPDTPFFKKLDSIIRNATAESKDDRLDSVARLRTLLLDAIEGFKKGSQASPRTMFRRQLPLHKPAWFWAGVAVTVLSVAVMTLWHLVGEPGKLKLLISSQHLYVEPAAPQAESSQSTPDDHPVSTAPPAKAVLSTDGTTLHFVTGGTVTLPQTADLGPQHEIEVDSFYMDETPVTYHQYVEFLNQNLSRIRVERSMVTAGSEIWLLLGKVAEDFEPIVFQDGQFKVSQAIYALYPVLRVTGFGATAYAHFYSRRLPTYTEWMFALKSEPVSALPIGHSSKSFGEQAIVADMHGQMHPGQEKGGSGSPPSGFRPSAVTILKSNLYGIRMSTDGFKEWSLRDSPVATRKNFTESDYIVLPSAVSRLPWEGFEDVGFRCARSLNRASAAITP